MVVNNKNLCTVCSNEAVGYNKIGINFAEYEVWRKFFADCNKTTKMCKKHLNSLHNEYLDYKPKPTFYIKIRRIGDAKWEYLNKFKG
jgi:hypothetical protein